jgi:DNA-binding MarR family transcriptional regulator
MSGANARATRDSVMGGAAPAGNVRADVLRYVRSYHQERHDTPSLGEIALAVGSTKPHVSRVLSKLEQDGALIRLPAPARSKRRIVLSDQRQEAIDTLRALGWTVNGEVNAADAPVTDGELFAGDLLSHLDPRARGERHGQGEEAVGTTDDRAAAGEGG